MAKVLRYLLICSCFSFSFSQKEKAVRFLQLYNKNITPVFKFYSEALWGYATNITKHNSKFKINVELQTADMMKAIRRNARKINLTDADEDTRRQFRILLETKQSSNKTVTKKLSEVGTDMSTIYNTGTILNKPALIKSITVEKGVKKLKLDKHLHNIISKSNDPAELLYVWKSWRKSVGPKVKNLYTNYVRLNNIGARENGFQDAGDYRRKQYEVDNLDKIAEDFLTDMRPIYEELHGYVRYRLSKVYKNLVKDEELIPAHLLGNMWAQDWEDIYRHVVPYPDEPALDATPLLKKNLTSVKRMFEEAEKFFRSIGWSKLPRTFWTHSLLTEPKDRKVECHPSAWDFSAEENNEPDVRIKMCTQITQNDFNTIHHELGHTYYQLLYWKQPMVYRDGANPGFHEAVGDTMTLSVQTPSHLKKVGLLGDVSETKEADINFLLKSALANVVFLPFGFIMDKWMWGVYDGSIPPSEYNTKWWEYRMKYQGIKAPIERSIDDFDPGAKMHIVSDVSYIRYFFAKILQFTFHKHACRVASDPGPLHKCSIYGSKKAGKALGRMLALGKSKPWPDVLEQYTGSRNISTTPIKEYFEPLIRWLRNYRSKEKYKLGWGLR